MQQLDHYDIAILDALQKNGRISRRALAEKIGLSLTPCNVRFNRLQGQDLIRSYNAEMDFTDIVEFNTIIVTVVLARHRTVDFEDFEAEITAIPQIVECFALTGGYDYIMKVVENSISDFQLLMQELLAKNPIIVKYHSYICTKTILAKQQPSVGYLVAQAG